MLLKLFSHWKFFWVGTYTFCSLKFNGFWQMHGVVMSTTIVVSPRKFLWLPFYRQCLPSIPTPDNHQSATPYSFLSLDHQIDGIIWHTAFWVWLLSQMRLSVIHIVIWTNSSFFYCSVERHCRNISLFVYIVTGWRTQQGCSQVLADVYKWSLHTHVQIFVRT